MYKRTEKLMSLVYNINYHLIVPIDRAPQRLNSQRYSHRWPNSGLCFFYPLHKNWVDLFAVSAPN